MENGDGRGAKPHRHIRKTPQPFAANLVYLQVTIHLHHDPIILRNPRHQVGREVLQLPFKHLDEIPELSTHHFLHEEIFLGKLFS